MKDTSQNYKKFYFNHDRNVEYKKEYVLTPHYHNMYEMYFITEGNCTYFIDNKTYQVMAGDMEAISFDGKNIQSTYAGHAPKNNSLPHGNGGVNLVFMDGHAVWRNFADCTRDIEYFSSKGDNVKNGIRW